jgi:hypothetical protein
MSNLYDEALVEIQTLKAEVDALKLGSLLTAVDVLQFINLKAENERLRKAGDELLDGWIGMYGDHKGSMAENYIKLWNAAKEGKPSV